MICGGHFTVDSRIYRIFIAAVLPNSDSVRGSRSNDNEIIPEK